MVNDKVKPVDIFITAHNRWKMTIKAIDYLGKRTKYPYRLFIIDNGSDKQLLIENVEYIRSENNYGIHWAWNIAKEMAESEYFITTDNDIYVPDLEPCWLSQLVVLLGSNSDYAAIALQPHEFLGAGSPKKDVEGIADVPHCGAHMRLMRTQLVRMTTGWKHTLSANRNDEEKTICNKLRDLGYKVGYTTEMRCYHDYGDDDNWGYGKIKPHTHGHRIPGKEIWPTPQMIKDKDKHFDKKTWLKKS
jgi:glycosyltransferase involved in cell wall biosynthesis